MTTSATKPSSPPYALLRAGFPFLATLGMRRVTTYPMDIVMGDDDKLFVLCRADSPGLGGSNIRRINWEDEDLDTLGGGKLLWPVQMIRDSPARYIFLTKAVTRSSSLIRTAPTLAIGARKGPRWAR